jgi:hypothetical protein
MRKILITIASALLLFIGASQGAYANESTGTVEFEPTNELPHVILPIIGPTVRETPYPLIDIPNNQLQFKPRGWGDAVLKLSGIYLLYVPTFDFGVNELATTDATYFAEKNYVSMIDMLPADEEGDSELDPGDIVATPQFVQVADYTGDDMQPFKVSVKQDTVFTNVLTDHELKSARISVDGFSLLNNHFNESTIHADFASLFVPRTSVGISLEDDVVVLANRMRNRGSLNGTITSAIFKRDYTRSDDVLVVRENVLSPRATTSASRPLGVERLRMMLFGDSSYSVKDEALPGSIVAERRAELLAAADSSGGTLQGGMNDEMKNYGVSLFVPRSDQAQKGRYTTSFTWTLSLSI